MLSFNDIQIGIAPMTRHDKLTQQFFNAATLPPEPAIAEFKIRRNSSMDRLQKAFQRAGVGFHTGRKSLFIAAPTPAQKRQLENEGVDMHSRQVKCSPRRG
jgi:hypothetical protein